ncbi:MAG: hypothetical protein JRI23_14155 [Deltaproteobacteria bacterium]|nr:hypothetical protein [Deltaproteobacteria bacterium]MBW2532881.1 hypothetical protein [Deltaproteobacteria bacterium]
MRELGALAVLAVFAGACTVEEDERELPTGPGYDPWFNDDVSCSADNPCPEGEFCGPNGVCQMERCNGTFESVRPLGLNHYFGIDGELVIINDASFVDGFESADGSYLSSWDLSGEAVLDVAGGAFNGVRPHGIAVATEFSDMVKIRQGNSIDEVSVGIWPKALAAGDTDADGLQELVAFAEDGSISVCHIDTGGCDGAVIQGAQGQDVAVADVDGDGYHEPIFLFEYSDKTELVVWNTDAAVTGQEESYGWQFNFGIKAIAAGDLDGDFVAEVLCLEDGGWFGFANDKLHVFSPQAGNILGATDIYGHSQDVAVGDTNSDDQAEVSILREDDKFELFTMDEPGQLTSVGEWDITVGNEAQRISMLDWDGDSASAKYMGGPDLIAGFEVPTIVMLFPPYPRGAANAPLNASVTVGNTETTSESMSDTISLSVGLAISFGADFGSFGKAKVGASFSQDVSVTQRVSKSMTIGARYWVPAAPDIHGTDYAAMLLSCGCYHRYAYETEDPDNKLDGSGKTMDIFVPVGGQTLLLSTTRYNAMAEQVPHLPVITPPVRIGDVASYPGAPTRFDGTPVPTEDMLFPDAPAYNASDVGFVNFWLVMGEQESNEVAEKTTIGISGSIGGYGVQIDGNIGIGVAQGYSITVGQDAIFAGAVPPIPDDPSTPEDEFEIHRFSFKPIVYREQYLTPEGEEAGYYVLSYTVGQ